MDLERAKAKAILARIIHTYQCDGTVEASPSPLFELAFGIPQPCPVEAWSHAITDDIFDKVPSARLLQAALLHGGER